MFSHEKKISTLFCWVGMFHSKTSLGNHWISECQQDAGGFEKGFVSSSMFSLQNRNTHGTHASFNIIPCHSTQKTSRMTLTKWRLTYHVDVHDTVENEPEILATIALSFLSHQKKCPNEFLERSDWNDKITIWKKCLCRCVGLMSEMKTCSVPHFGDGCNKMCKPHTEKKKVTPGISEAYPVLFRWKVVTHGFRAWQCQQKQPCTFNPWAVNKTLVTFQYTSWFLGILIMSYFVTPIWLGCTNLYITQTNQN